VSLDEQLLGLGEQLRAEGVALGTSELLDAFAALREIDWRERRGFQQALSATLAKSPEDRRVFDLVFERFFFRAVESAALAVGIDEAAAASGAAAGAQIDLEELRTQIAQALANGDEARMADLARLALAAVGRPGDGSNVVGIDVQRIRRALGLRSDPQPAYPPGDPRREGLPREALRRFEAILRRELERAQIQRTMTLPPSRPLGELDRALPSGPTAASPRAVWSAAGRGATTTSTSAGRCAHRCRPAVCRSS
jgi:hypothetical protein